jgi:hypothetical protein
MIIINMNSSPSSSVYEGFMAGHPILLKDLDILLVGINGPYLMIIL